MKLTSKTHTRTITALLGWLALAALVVTEANAGGDFASNNVSLYSHLDLGTFGSNSGNDCWGYVSPSGREYALMGLDNKVAFVEITDPANADWFASVSHDASLWGDVKVYQDVAYVVTDVSSAIGIQVIDMSDIDNHVVALVRTICCPTQNHNIAVDADSGYLYTCGSSGGSATTVIFDLSDPTNPVEVGTWSGAYEHDAQVVLYTGPDTDYAGSQIMFGASEGRGLDVIDVTDKSNPVLISRTEYANVSYCHQVWTEDQRYLYINDELDSIPRTIVFDITDLDNPLHLGDVTSGTNATDHNQYVHGGMIFAANYRSGLRIFCATDPINPVQVGWFDTYPGDDGAGFDGAWSVYPFFPSGTVIVSDINRGLFVLDPTDTLNGALTFAYPKGRPDLIDPQGGTAVRVEIGVVCEATIEPATAMLHYDIGQGFVDVPMEPVSENLYDAVFPAIDCGLAVSYYVSAQSAGGTTFTDPPNAPATTFSTLSAADVLIALEDDLETDSDWIVGGGDDDATTGVWTRVNPIGTSAQPEDDHTPDPGTMCFVTGQGKQGGGLGENDVDDGQTTLTSPVFDLADEADAIMGYWRWYSNNQGNSPNADIFVIDISNDNGSTWTNVETIGPAGPGTSGGWLHHSFSVSDFVEPTSEVRMRFIASDEGDGSIVEVAIDDLDISIVVCDGGTIGPDDFSAFRGFYVSGDLDSLLESDDDKLCYEPGIVLGPTEAPVTLDFLGSLPNDSPASLDVTIESSANTVGLELTFSFWNYNTNSWDVVGTESQSLDVDTVRTFAGIPADHVEPGTGAVMTRYEVRQTGPVFLFPWTDCVDQVVWTTTN